MVVIFTIFIDILHHDFHLSMEITLDSPDEDIMEFLPSEDKE